MFDAWKQPKGGEAKENRAGVEKERKEVTSKAAGVMMML
jgi:hypothetical protein